MNLENIAHDDNAELDCKESWLFVSTGDLSADAFPALRVSLLLQLGTTMLLRLNALIPLCRNS